MQPSRVLQAFIRRLTNASSQELHRLRRIWANDPATVVLIETEAAARARADILQNPTTIRLQSRLNSKLHEDSSSLI